jgi:hypothetical protein
MAKHTIFGVGPTIFFSNSPGSQHRPLYMVPTELGILNNDGTHVYFTGTGFSYDWVNGIFTGGVVNSIVHYDINGNLLDEMTGLSVPATSLDAVFFSIAEYGSNSGPDPLNLLSGNDYINARVRAMVASSPTTSMPMMGMMWCWPAVALTMSGAGQAVTRS